MYPLSVPPQPEVGIPGLKATFGRVTVMMGANGSGKSKILASIRDSYGDAFGSARPILYIEGGRVVPIPNSLKLTRQNVNEFSDYSTAFSHYSQKRTGKLSDRISDVLFTIDRRSEDDKTQHSDAVTEWLKGDQEKPCPRRDEPPLDRLFRLFAEVLPHVKLRITPTRALMAQRGSSEYPAVQLSDGEKQALAILADIAILADPQSLILVDEPELNLHPLLASNLWGTIENDLPDAVFVYATHSLGFAMRRDVDQVIAVSNRSDSMEIGDPSSLDPTELRPFLGSIPAILSSANALIVEGDDFSFDKPFYRWLLGPEVEIVPLGSGSDVFAATSRTGVWERLTPGLRIVGLIDRDYRDDHQLERLTCGTCEPLGLHEAESYLCDPTLLGELAANLGLMDPAPTAKEIEAHIRRFAQTSLIRTAAQRAFARSTVSLSVSLPRQVIASIENDTEILKLLREQSEREASKGEKLLSSDEVEKVYLEEQLRCSRALEGSIQDVLRLVPGKELLEQLAKKIGCRNSRQILAAAKKHIDPAEFVSIGLLQRQLKGLFGLDADA